MGLSHIWEAYRDYKFQNFIHLHRFIDRLTKIISFYTGLLFLLPDLFVKICVLPVSKQRTKSVPEADWFPLVSIRLCPRELWQKNLLFSHHPGGPRPLGQASPCDWQLRKHNRPPHPSPSGRGEWMRAQHGHALVPPLCHPPPSHLWPGLCATAHITFTWRLGVTCAEVRLFLTLKAADQEYTPPR